MEITIEQKAKAYDEAIKRAKELLEIGVKDTRDKRVVLSFFPELAESEDGIKDERIRKAVISTFKSHCSFYEVSVDEVLAWFEKRFSKSRQKEIDDAYLKGVCDAKHELEKQGEQKPAEWNKNDEVLLDETLHFIREFQQSDRCINEGDMQNSVTCENWLKSLKNRVQPQPKQEWSKEDEQLYNDLSDTYFYNDEDYPEETYKLMLKRVLDWMTKRAKSLRPQSTWKPSDNELKVLRLAAEKDGTCLMGLYEQLKKLKE